VNELRSNASAIGVNNGQTIAFRANGKFMARQGTAIFGNELRDLHLFVRGQPFDLLNDFNRTHSIIIRHNLFLARRIGLRSAP
jgi:hypothetical protein